MTSIYPQAMAYEKNTTSLLEAWCCFMAFSCTLPMIASHSSANEITRTPMTSKLGEVLASAGGIGVILNR